MNAKQSSFPSLDARTSEVPRKIVHIATLGFAFALRYLSPVEALICALSACAFNLWCLPHIGHGRILRPSERSPLGSGPFFYSLSVLLLILIFRGHLHIVAAAWALMSLGDGAAGLSGRQAPRLRIPWNPQKSISGLIRFVVFGGLGALVLMVWTLRSSPIQSSWTELSVICLGVAICCAVVESLPWKLNDNLTVPLAAGILFYLLLHTSLLGTLRSQGFAQLLAAGLLLNLLLASVAWMLGWIRRSGALAGILLGTAIFISLGARGVAVLLAFLALGSVSTRFGDRSKRALGISQVYHGARGAREALANGISPALFAILASVTPHRDVFLVGFVAALGAATADTVSSEIGQSIGGEPFLITNLARVRPGTNGAITIKGTLSGMVAVGLLGLVALQLGLISSVQFWIVQVAGLAGNLTDSFLGATLEGDSGIDNESVNFLNTLAGAGTGMALAWCLRGPLAS